MNIEQKIEKLDKYGGKANNYLLGEILKELNNGIEDLKDIVAKLK